MANVLYPLGKKAILDGSIAFLTDDIRVILIDLADYTYSTAHQFLSDVAALAQVAVSGALGTKTTTGGVFDAADVTLAAVTGDVSEALIIYKHTGVDTTAALIAFIDTGVTGFPVTPNGGDIQIQWDAGANKIFAL